MVLSNEEFILKMYEVLKRSDEISREESGLVFKAVIQGRLSFIAGMERSREIGAKSMIQALREMRLIV